MSNERTASEGFAPSAAGLWALEEARKRVIHELNARGRFSIAASDVVLFESDYKPLTIVAMRTEQQQERLSQCFYGLMMRASDFLFELDPADLSHLLNEGFNLAYKECSKLEFAQSSLRNDFIAYDGSCFAYIALT